MKLLIAVFLTITTMQSVNAGELCGYSRHTPEGLLYKLRHDLSDRGIAVAAPQVYSQVIPTLNWMVLRDSRLLSQIELVTDSTQTTLLNIRDAYGKSLFTAEEQVTSCSTGRCKWLKLSDKFTLSFENGVVRYYVNGLGVYAADWRRAFESEWDWLLGAISSSHLTYAIPARDVSETLFFILASDPFVVDYLNRVRISQSGNRVIVSGRLPHFIYNQIVDLAIRHYITNIQMNVVIDSAAVIPEFIPERLLNCH